MEPSAPRLRHRLRSPRLWRAVALAALSLFVLWSAAWFYLPPIVAAEARQAAERELGRPLVLGKVVFNPWTLELTIDDIALAGAAAGAPPVFEARRVYADIAATSLLRLAPVIDRFELDAPMLRVTRLDADRYDVDDILARIAARPRSAEPVRFAVHNIVVRDGAADVIDRPLAATHRLRELALAVPFVSSLPSEREIKVEPHLAFALDGSRFDSAGTATPFAERGNGELRVRLDGFSVQPYLGYLPRDLPARLRAATTCGASMSIRFSRTRFSSGRSSAISTLSSATCSRSRAAASATSMPLAPTTPAMLSESFGRCSKAITRSALSVAARNRAGRSRGR